MESFTLTELFMFTTGYYLAQLGCLLGMFTFSVACVHALGVMYKYWRKK